MHGSEARKLPGRVFPLPKSFLWRRQRKKSQFATPWLGWPLALTFSRFWKASEKMLRAAGIESSSFAEESRLASIAWRPGQLPRQSCWKATSFCTKATRNAGGASNSGLVWRLPSRRIRRGHATALTPWERVASFARGVVTPSSVNFISAGAFFYGHLRDAA